MIVATKKCGCPPPKDNKPSCSPCCGSRKKVTIRNPKKRDCPAAACCKKSTLKSALKPRAPEQPSCCPMKPIEDQFERPSKIRSEIAERGIPYKEIEAVINNNRVVIRTQKEMIPEEFDPPCDCKEETQPVAKKVGREIDHSQPTTNKVVTLFPRAKDISPEANEENSGNMVENVEEPEVVVCRNVEENPNIFMFRVKNSSIYGDKRFNIHLEFKTPRPWSHKKRMEYENATKSAKLTLNETVHAREDKEDEKNGESGQGTKKIKK